MQGCVFTTETDTEIVRTSSTICCAGRIEPERPPRPRFQAFKAPSHSPPVRGRERSDDRRAQRAAACDWLRRRRNVSRLGRDCTCAVHQPHHLSRGRRLGGADPGSADHLRQGQRVVQRDAIKHRFRRRWSTRPTIATSWPRRSTSSRRSSATRWRATSTSRPTAWRCRCLPFDFANIQRIIDRRLRHRVLCGLRRQILVRALARLPVELDIASEFRYREAPLPKDDLAIFISQSGETADTLAALRYAKAQGVHTLSVVNVPSSTIARESETRVADARRPRDRRRLDQGVHLPVDGAGRGRDRRGQRARANCPMPTRPSLSTVWWNPAPDGGRARNRAADRKARARSRRNPRTCSISAAAPAIRSRWKARSS